MAKIEKLVGIDYYKVKDMLTDMGFGVLETRESGSAA
jgi:hypothetical protein